MQSSDNGKRRIIIFREKAVEKKGLPSGYNWRTETYTDDEGIVITVTLVESNHKPGSWKDKVFGREILSASDELDIEAEQEEIHAVTEKMKQKVGSHFFAWMDR